MYRQTGLLTDTIDDIIGKHWSLTMPIDDLPKPRRYHVVNSSMQPGSRIGDYRGDRWSLSTTMIFRSRVLFYSITNQESCTRAFLV